MTQPHSPTSPRTDVTPPAPSPMQHSTELTPLGRWLEALVHRSKLLSRIMLVIMALLVVADVAIPTGYDRFFWETIGGAGAVYGLFACVVIVVVSKFLGYQLLYRPEDYFDNEREANELTGDPMAREQTHD
jgi:hypothetical protein